MLNIEVFQDLCRRAAAESDPTELEKIKDALMFVLRTEQIELYGVEKSPGLNPTKACLIGARGGISTSAPHDIPWTSIAYQLIPSI